MNSLLPRKPFFVSALYLVQSCFSLKIWRQRFIDGDTQCFNQQFCLCQQILSEQTKRTVLRVRKTGRKLNVNVQMKCSDTGRQSEFISVHSGGNREMMRPASVRPHRKGFGIISTMIIVPNRRCHGSGAIRPDGCPCIFYRRDRASGGDCCVSSSCLFLTEVSSGKEELSELVASLFKKAYSWDKLWKL